MNENNNNKNNENDENRETEEILNELKTNGTFDILPYEHITNIEDNPKYKKLEMTSAQKMQLNSVAANLPKVVSAGSESAVSRMVSSNDFFVMRVPKGLVNSLMKYKNGSGYGNVLFDSNGHFAKQVPLVRMDISSTLAARAAVASAFNVMSIATFQYYLSCINNELSSIKLGMDKILEFLYGDKRAELMAEVMFAKYAFNNYSSIMTQEPQRIATISGLQQSRKIAMKDSEFYISDLDATINEKQDIVSVVNKSLKIKESLDLALQLCVMSTILEIHYSQNFDSDYLKYIEDDVALYIDKCEKLILGNFNKLQVLITSANAGIWKKVNKEQLQSKVVNVLEKFKNGGESELTKSLRSGIHITEKSSTYYINKDGDVYLRTA